MTIPEGHNITPEVDAAIAQIVAVHPNVKAAPMVMEARTSSSRTWS